MSKIFLLFSLVALSFLPTTTIQSQNIAPFDLVINEIMADFNPSVGLPAFEWIEIYNRSAGTINLENFELSSGSSPKRLPNFELVKGAYVLVTDDSNVLELSAFGDAVELSTFPSLSNSGDIVTLTDLVGNIIHEVAFDISWYRDNIKDNGGYTLELINPQNPCLLKNNWIASLDEKGGTPGVENSVFEPNLVIEGPKLISAIPLTQDQIDIRFDKSISPTTNEMQFLLTPGNVIVDLNFGTTSDHITLTMGAPLDSGVVYLLQIQQGLEDCLGNATSQIQSIEIVVPERLEIDDIIINEILFNPKTNGSDFIEIYNTSDKYLDLSKLSIGNFDENGNGTKKEVNQTIILGPLDFLVLSEDILDVQTRYSGTIPTKIVTVDLPSFDNTDGNVTLLGIVDNEESILDEMNYSEEMHNPFIDDHNGISLERVSPSLSSSTRENWQSASAGSGFGTPTLPNSQNANAIKLGNNRIELLSKSFSPNGDDQNDVLEVIFELDKSDYLATIDVFDGYGRYIDQIASNQLLGRSDKIIWDGFDSERKLGQAGIYIIFVKLLRSDGFVFKKKLPCVLSAKL